MGAFPATTPNVVVKDSEPCNGLRRTAAPWALPGKTLKNGRYSGTAGSMTGTGEKERLFFV